MVNQNAHFILLKNNVIYSPCFLQEKVLEFPFGSAFADRVHLQFAVLDFVFQISAAHNQNEPCVVERAEQTLHFVSHVDFHRWSF